MIRLLLVLTVLPTALVIANDAEVRKRQQAVKELTVKETDPEQDRFLHSKELEIEKKITESIALLKRLINKTQGEKRGELLFRLAEAYWEKSRYLSFIINYQYEQKIKRYEALKTKGVTGLSMPELNLKPAEQHKREAIKVYQTIAKNHPRFDRLDRVYFFMALNLRDLGKKAPAEKIYLKFLEKFPRSVFREDAHLALGEMYFQDGTIPKALERYKSVMAMGSQSSLYNYALYKSGWCYYNLQQFDRSVAAFKAVVEYEDRNPQSARKVKLKEEALNDLVLAYSEVGEVDEAERYFKGIGGAQYYLRLLKRLAYLYFDQGKFQSSGETFKRLLKEDPFGPDSPEFQNKVVDAYKKLQDKERTNKEMSLLVNAYHPRSTWAQQNSKKPEVIQKATKLVETTLRVLATGFHSEAKKTLRVETVNLAIANYRLYLTFFADHANAYEIRFLYAELLFDQKQFNEAALQYQQVAADKQTKHKKDAALNAILSWQELLKRETLKRPDKTKDTSLQPISNHEIALVQACDRFLEWLPNDPKTADVQFEAAVIFYEYNHFDEAIKRLDRVIEKYPTQFFAVKAARLAMASLNFQNKFFELNQTARKHYRNKILAAQKLDTVEKQGEGKFKTFGDELYDFIKASAFKYAVQLETNRKFESAATEFIKFEKEFPKSEYADKALYNAALNFQRTQNLTAMIDVGKKMLAGYPKSSLTPKVIYSVCLKYEQNVEFLKAAEYFELLARSFPEFEKSADAALTAAVYREAEKKYDEAIRVLGMFVANYPKRPDAKEVQLHMGELIEKQKRYLPAINQYRTVLETYPNDPDLHLRAYRSIGVNYMHYGNPIKAAFAFDNAIKAYNALSADRKKRDESRHALGEVRFWLIDALYREFTALKPTGDIRSYARGLERRIGLVSRLQVAYSEIAQFKSPAWTIKSLCRMGEVFRLHSDDYLGAPVPESLNEAQKANYKKELDQGAKPVVDRADEFFTTCVKTAQDLDYFSNEVVEAEGYFERRQPARAVKNFTVPLVVDATAESEELYGRIRRR